MQPWQIWKNQPPNTKIALFEIDIPTAIPFWLNDSPGVWKYRYTNYGVNTVFNFQNGSFCYGSFKNSGIANTGTNNTIQMISSFIVNGVNYPRMSTHGLCKRTNYSFYYDPDTTILYVNFFDILPWNIRSVKAGVTRGFATQAIYLNNIYYEPRIKSFPQINIKTDDLFFGIRKYSAGSISFYNEDGEFNNFASLNVFGQECRAKIGGKLFDGTMLGYDDFKTFFTGYIKKLKTTASEMTVDIGDKKDKIGKSLPVNFFSSTDYPYIKDGNDGKGIPLSWGTCRNIKCICVNEDQAGPPANYKFVFADIEKHSVKSLDSVYIDGILEAGPALVNDTTNNIAYFNIASGGNYEPGKTVTADITGFDDSTARDGSGDEIKDALDVVKDIFNDYLNIYYNSDNFIIDRWAQEESGDYSQGIFIDKNTKISAILEKICVGHLGIFINDGDGKWSFRTINDSARIQMKIGIDEIFDEPDKEDDGEKYLTSANIKYNEDYANNDYKEKTDNTYETTTFDNYGISRTQDFETYLTSSTDAAALAAKIINEFKTIKSYFNKKVSIRAIDLQLFDVIVIYIDRKYSTWLGPVKARVMGKKLNLNNPMTVDLTLKYIADDTGDAIIDMLIIKKMSLVNYNFLISKISANDNFLTIQKWR